MKATVTDEGDVLLEAEGGAEAVLLKMSGYSDWMGTPIGGGPGERTGMRLRSHSTAFPSRVGCTACKGLDLSSLPPSVDVFCSNCRAEVTGG